MSYLAQSGTLPKDASSNLPQQFSGLCPLLLADLPPLLPYTPSHRHNKTVGEQLSIFQEHLIGISLYRWLARILPSSIAIPTMLSTGGVRLTNSEFNQEAFGTTSLDRVVTPCYIQILDITHYDHSVKRCCSPLRKVKFVVFRLDVIELSDGQDVPRPF